jgi:hypothetical protein
MSKCVKCRKETKACKCKFRVKYKGKPAPEKKNDTDDK